jgi:hypothetical protein
MRHSDATHHASARLRLRRLRAPTRRVLLRECGDSPARRTRTRRTRLPPTSDDVGRPHLVTPHHRALKALPSNLL